MLLQNMNFEKLINAAGNFSLPMRNHQDLIEEINTGKLTCVSFLSSAFHFPTRRFRLILNNLKREILVLEFQAKGPFSKMLVPFLELKKKEEIGKKFRSKEDQLRMYENFRHLNLAELKKLLGVVAPQLDFKLPEQTPASSVDAETSQTLIPDRSSKQYSHSFAEADDSLKSEADRRREEEVEAMTRMSLLDAFDLSQQTESSVDDDAVSENEEFAMWKESQEARLQQQLAVNPFNPGSSKSARAEPTLPHDDDVPDYEELESLKYRRRQAQLEETLQPANESYADSWKWAQNFHRRKGKEHFDDDGEFIFREPSK